MKNKTDELSVQSEFTNEEIKNSIYTIRGRQVMLDSDVAKFYQYETKNVNKAVKRNIEKFPEDFCFRLTENEVNDMWFQFGTTSKELKYRSEKYLPYVFTVEGISMLAGVLKTERAIKVSIQIIRAFVEMRKFLISNGHIFERITNLEYKQLENEKNFNLLFEQMGTKQIESQKIFFEGQIYDAYSLIIDIIQKANNKIVIIDNYLDKSILDMLTKKHENVEVVIMTSTKNSNIQNIDVQKFNKQYPTLKLGKTDKFHDRFIIIDNKELYHCGASIKDLGKKCFGINKIEDERFLKEIVSNI